MCANLQSYNRYSYVLNNPLRYTDPTGYAWYSFLTSPSFWIGNVRIGRNRRRLREYGRGGLPGLDGLHDRANGYDQHSRDSGWRAMAAGVERDSIALGGMLVRSWSPC